MSSVKKGQVWEPILGGTPIELVKPHKTERFWNTKKLNGSATSHRIHEGTLKRFYRLSQQPVTKRATKTRAQ